MIRHQHFPLVRIEGIIIVILCAYCSVFSPVNETVSVCGLNRWPSITISAGRTEHVLRDTITKLTQQRQQISSDIVIHEQILQKRRGWTDSTVHLTNTGSLIHEQILQKRRGWTDSTVHHTGSLIHEQILQKRRGWTDSTVHLTNTGSLIHEQILQKRRGWTDSTVHLTNTGSLIHE